MPLTRKPKHPEDQLLQCIESFASGDELGGCARGTRLLGSHPKVKRWPQYFLSADTPDDQVEAARRDLYPDGAYLNV